MKSLLFIAALATAAPAAFVATESAAQVLTGRNAASRANSAPRRRPPPPPPSGLTREEQAELRDAQAEVVAIDARLAEYQRLHQAGALTEDVRVRWEADVSRRAELTDTIEMLIELRDN